jgi:tetratricopeptide (TPR) repeat protein
VALVYFDVDQRAYKTVFTDPIHLEVTPSVEQHQAVAPTVLPGDHPPVKQGVDLVNKDILEIKEGLSVLKNYREIEPLFFALFMLIPAALFAVLKLFVRVSQKDVTIEQQMAQKAKYHLKQALKTGSPKKEYENTRTRNTNPGEQGFLAHLYSALVAIVLARAKKKGETVTAAEAQTILRNAQVEEKDINEITGLIDSIESARFGGNLVDKRTADQLLSRTKQMMKLLCLVLALAALSALAPEKARADVATIFSNGIKSYQAGDFKAAAAEFERLAEQPIKNPFLFYNIGNAYLKAGDLGRAILWYERARAMAPNDPDLNFNLAHADTLVKDKKERDINVMEVLFFWDRLVSNKTIQISAIFSCFVFFAWAGIRVVKKQHIFSGLGMILLSILVLLSIVVSINYTSRFLGREAVIIKEEVAVRSGMTDTATELFALHAGSRVRVEEKRNGYLKIVFSKGRVGWVKDKDALII